MSKANFELSGAFFWHVMHLHYNEFPARCLLIKHHFWLRPCLLENVGFLYGTNNIIICFQAFKKQNGGCWSDNLGETLILKVGKPVVDDGFGKFDELIFDS